MTSVYVVILNWNGWRDTIECLESNYKSMYPNFEIVLVDNGSNDGSIDYLQPTFPQVKIISLNANLGFAKAMNIGIKSLVIV